MTDIRQKAYMMQKVVQTARPFSYFALSARAAAEHYAAQCPNLVKKDLADVPELPSRALARLHTMWDDEKNPDEQRLIASYEDAFRAFEKSRALADDMKKKDWMPALRAFYAKMSDAQFDNHLVKYAQERDMPHDSFISLGDRRDYYYNPSFPHADFAAAVPPDHPFWLQRGQWDMFLPKEFLDARIKRGKREIQEGSRAPEAANESASARTARRAVIEEEYASAMTKVGIFEKTVEPEMAKSARKAVRPASTKSALENRGGGRD